MEKHDDLNDKDAKKELRTVVVVPVVTVFFVVLFGGITVFLVVFFVVELYLFYFVDLLQHC